MRRETEAPKLRRGGAAVVGEGAIRVLGAGGVEAEAAVVGDDGHTSSLEVVLAIAWFAFGGIARLMATIDLFRGVEVHTGHFFGAAYLFAQSIACRVTGKPLFAGLKQLADPLFIAGKGVV